MEVETAAIPANYMQVVFNTIPCLYILCYTT